jgi:uncharacterized protein with GYD domain
MGTFFLTGRYTAEAAKGISVERTRQAREIMRRLGGELKDAYALLGDSDLVLIVQLPNMTEAMKASVLLGKQTGISFSTAAAIPVEEFDQMMANL